MIMEKPPYKILIGVTGSVAAIKIPNLVQSLLAAKDNNYDVEIRLVVTEHAKHFFEASELPQHVVFHDDAAEWGGWHARGDPVLHIELGRWADMLLIAPLDANTLAKMAQGICDNLLTCTTRAWDMRKPLIFCPAMNTRMWDHPVTGGHIQQLVGWGHTLIPPIEKTLICGDVGNGAMAEVNDIVKEVNHAIRNFMKEINVKR